MLAALVLVSGALPAHQADARIFGLSGRVVLLDPGHGGKDPGTVHQEAQEADINVNVANRLAEELRDAGVTVVLTRGGRDGMLPLTRRYKNRPRAEMEARIRLARSLSPDAYLSLHCNAWTGGGLARGAQVFVDPGATAGSVRLGEILTESLVRYAGTRRPLSRKIDHYLLKQLRDHTVVTVEMGYLTDAGDRRNLVSPAYQRTMARIIALGLVRYMTDLEPLARPPDGGLVE